ncbi:MAG: hypothetical protein ACKVOE_07275 [Rickettsiales bacterium]
MKYRALLCLLTLMGLSACTPADEQYCQRFGVGGTSEFGKCLDYFHTQEAAFGADYQQCAFEADYTYPPTLYDNGRTVHFSGGFYGGRYFGGGTEFIEPDYYHNSQVDALRQRIIEPCMQSLGWNSSITWQAGRHAVTNKPPRKPATAIRSPRSETLPWQQ